MKGIEIDAPISPIVDRDNLQSYIEELNEKESISVNDIRELAHAWGNDQVSNLEAYLFLKKSNATLERNITIDDIEQYLRFESKYGQTSVFVNISQLISLLFAEKEGNIPWEDFE